MSEGLGHKDCCKDIVFYVLIYFIRLKYFYNVSFISLNEFSIGRDTVDKIYGVQTQAVYWVFILSR